MSKPRAFQKVPNGMPKTKAVARVAESRGISASDIKPVTYNKAAGSLSFEMKDGSVAPATKK